MWGGAMLRWSVRTAFTFVFWGALICHPSIEQRIEQIRRSVPGEIGVAALHIESGKRVEFDGNKRFPMASTYKIPIALCCLSLVDQGVLSLEKTVKLSAFDIRRGSCSLKVGQELSLKELLELTLEHSDNTTSDIILKMVGGGNAVTRWVHKQGISQMRIDRPTLTMLATYSGIVDRLGDKNRCTVARYNYLLKNISAKNRAYAARKFYDDELDTTTPRAMVDLLAQMYRGKCAKERSTQFLFECMEECHWGGQRIEILLPKRTRVWHKTGTIDGIVSVIGIIELPRNKGHIAVACYSNRSLKAKSKRERAFARIARTLFDYYSRIL